MSVAKDCEGVGGSNYFSLLLSFAPNLYSPMRCELLGQGCGFLFVELHLQSVEGIHHKHKP